MKSKSAFKDVVIILLITLGLFAATEIILRALFPEKTAKFFRPQSLAYEFNKDYLASLKPNIEKIVTKEENGAYTMYWNTNSNSFRGKELRKDPEPRIIVYGDSNIEARYSKLENTFVYKLESYLREAGLENAEAVNAGVVGFGPDQSLIRFEKEADVYNPDIVVFSINAHNDFGDIIRNRLFDLDQRGSLKETSYEKTVDQALKEKSGFPGFISSLRSVKAARKIKGFVTGGGAVAKTGGDSAESLIRRLPSLIEKEYTVYAESKPRYFSAFGDHYDLDVALSPDAGSSKVKVKLMEEIIKRAKSAADSKGVHFLVLIQPSVVDLTRNFALSYEHLQEYPGYRKANLTDAVKDICVLNNINYINLFDVFSENNPETLFFTGKNDHWNDQGQDIAAKETALRIMSKIASNSDHEK